MRTFISLVAVVALAACGGGGGSSTPPAPLATQTPVTPKGNLITPQFVITVPRAGTSSSQRKPAYVSSGTQSVTVTLTAVNGSSANLPQPTSATTNISGAFCSAGCNVNGPASPPGSDTYVVTTYDAQNGGGNALSTGSTTATLAPAANTTVNIVLNGIPFGVAIANVPTSWHANTTGNTQALTVTVTDHAGQTITGPYANSVRITDPDPHNTTGTSITGTHPGTGCTTTCVDVTNSGDTVTLQYGGLAENPVVLASSGTGVGLAGTATFTPILNPIVSEPANPTSLSTGDTGIDLFSNVPSSPAGYTGTVKYYEDGFTNAPYGQTLSAIVNPDLGDGTCAGFATLTTGANVTTGSHTDTPFTATAIANPTAGTCSVSVTDNLTDQPNPLPTFAVTYTTASPVANSKRRHGR